jgi:hypothetical protein
MEGIIRAEEKERTVALGSETGAEGSMEVRLDRSGGSGLGQRRDGNALFNELGEYLAPDRDKALDGLVIDSMSARRLSRAAEIAARRSDPPAGY